MTGIGRSHGTPSCVKVSIIRCDTKPIMKAYHIISIFISGKLGCRICNKYLKLKPKINIPITECDRKRCPPSSLVNVFPTNPPTGKFRQKGAVGWSISGAMPPIIFTMIAVSPVAREIFSTGKKITVRPKAVNAARSCVLPVIYGSIYYKV